MGSHVKLAKELPLGEHLQVRLPGLEQVKLATAGLE